MTKKLILASMLVGALAFTLAQRGTGPMNSATTLTPQAQEALLEALTGPVGEYAAYATYDAIIQKYGNLEPYLTIRNSEAQHISALQRQLQKYGVSYPSTNPFLGKAHLPADLKAIAEEEAQTEINNVAMYDKLLKAVPNYTDLTRVFTNLQRASQVAHLPMFKAAAEKGGQLTAAQMQEIHSQIQLQMQGQMMGMQGHGRGQGFGGGNHNGMNGQGHGPWWR